MYVVLTLDEYNKMKETSRKLGLFTDSLNNELELKKREIGFYSKTKSEDAVKNLKQTYSGMLFVKDILDIAMSD